MSFSRFSRETVAFASRISVDSVTSMTSDCGSSLLDANAPSTWPMSCSVSNWRMDTLTDMVVRKPCACHDAACAQAVFRTHWPTSTIIPVSSRTGMKSMGSMTPRVGCCQRISASTPRMEAVSRSKIGW